MKPALLDVKFLKEYEKNYDLIYEENPNTSLEISLNLKFIQIKTLFQNIKIENFSCRKLSELYQKQI